jgi:predicted O-methyltransferase YrrM
VVFELENINYRLNELEARIDLVEGFLVPGGGEILYLLAYQHMPSPNAVIVEIGSWKGKSTTWLAFGLKDRNADTKVYAVDTWRGSPEHQQGLAHYSENQLFDEFVNNIRKMEIEDYVVSLRGTSIKRAQEWNREIPIGLLHIDAALEYESVREDFEHWSPMVMKNGIIVFDDVPSAPGVCRLVTELPHWYKQVAVGPNKWIVQKL